MNALQTSLLKYFKQHKNILAVPYKELKKEILNSSVYELCQNYSVHIYELSFYNSELKQYL